MSKVIFCFIFIGLLLTTCKKKPSSFIEMGNNAGMDVISLNMHFWGGSWSDPTEEKLDINNDGNIDVSFIGKRSASGTGVQGELSIKCLNPNLLLMGGVFDDTTFVKTDTIIHSDAGLIYFEVQKQYRYSRLHINDSIVSFNHFPF